MKKQPNINPNPPGARPELPPPTAPDADDLRIYTAVALLGMLSCPQQTYSGLGRGVLALEAVTLGRAVAEAIKLAESEKASKP